MKRIIVGLLVGVAMLVLVVPVLAKNVPNGQAGKSNTAHLYLYEKVPSGNWPIVEGGAWGKMTYNQSGPTFDYVFNGHRLQPSIEYSLIYYADPWPGNHPGALIANGMSSEDGNIHLAGSTDLEISIPTEPDANVLGGKIWLVPSSDYNSVTQSMINWNPTKYLFEYDLINFDQE